jgi:hypothetical protein
MTGLTQFQATATALEPESRIDLESFLRRMSEAMVGAQTRLDDESGRYLAATAGQRHIMPSIFRVPKLTAQMRFALEVENNKTLNLLFYKRDEKTTSRNEQGIDFDIVSVPAPPDALSGLRTLAPRMDLVLDAFERERLLGVLVERGQPDLSRLAAENPTALVILALSPQSGRSEYLVFAATEVKEHSVGLWLLTVPDEGEAAIQLIYPLNRKNAENEHFLKDLILALAKRQAEFFSG